MAGCKEKKLSSGVETTLTATGDRVILKGDITELYCTDNKLTELNVQGLNNLTYLRCYNNQFKKLNVQGLTSLKVLDCYNNQLDKAAFTKLFNDLPKRTADDKAKCVLYAEIDGITELNYKDFTSDELQVIKNKKWKPLKQIGKQFTDTVAIE